VFCIVYSYVARYVFIIGVQITVNILDTGLASPTAMFQVARNSLLRWLSAQCCFMCLHRKTVIQCQSRSSRMAMLPQSAKLWARCAINSLSATAYWMYQCVTGSPNNVRIGLILIKLNVRLASLYKSIPSVGLSHLSNFRDRLACIFLDSFDHRRLTNNVVRPMDIQNSSHLVVDRNALTTVINFLYVARNSFWSYVNKLAYHMFGHFH